MKIRKTVLAAVLCIALLFTACGRDGEPGEGDSYVYCLNESGTGLVKVACDIPEEDTREAAESVLDILATPAENIDYINPIPGDVKVQSCELFGGIMENECKKLLDDYFSNMRGKILS